MRLVLRGSSVVDWFRMHLASRDEIAALLRVNGLDPDDPKDAARLEEIRRGACRYLKVHLGYKLPEEVDNADVLTTFEYAAGKGKRAHRMFACIVLKVMHVIHYTEGHELLSRLPISAAEVAILLHAKVERVVRSLLARRYPIVEFSGNTKTYDSTMSKLLAKKDTQAAQVFDKLRFRLVVERLEDVPPLLVGLTRELIPFNYIVPNQSENSLLDIDQVLRRAGNLPAIRSQKHDPELNEDPYEEFSTQRRNEFSGPGFRVVHFIAEVPVRVDRVLPFQSSRLLGLGPVVFGTVELQVMDRVTAENNEAGENRHDRYKARQLARVRERLERGKRKKERG